MADPIRLYVDAPLGAGAVVTATPGQAHRLGTVMRRAAGDPVRLFNGRDGEWRGRIETLRRGQATLRAEALGRAQDAEPGPALLFAPLKRDATDLVAEKATELGAAALRPVVTARTVVGRVATDRMALIAAEAAEQSERLTVPAVSAPCGLAQVLASWPDGQRLAVAVERLDAPFGLIDAEALLVGPEGGFAPEELDLLRAQPFVVPVSLGPRILRAETAAIAGLALLGGRSALAAASRRPS